MKIGLIARADKTGLAIQTWNFWRAVQPEATLVVDLSRYGHPSPDMGSYPVGAVRWEANMGVGADPHDSSVPDPQIDWLLDQVDCVFTVETPYNFYLYEEAKRRGIRTVLQPNFEFFEYLTPSQFPEPDCFALPSLWHINEIRDALPGRDVRYLPVPVDTSLLPYKECTELHEIMHSAGTVAQPFRNGTPAFFAAMALLQDIPDLRGTAFAQRNTVGEPPPNVELVIGPFVNYWDLYASRDFDMMVLPRRWGGLCLPMQEALASGMPVIMPDCDPNNRVLPPSMLVPCHIDDQLMTRSLIDLCDVDPVVLAQRIRYYHDNPRIVNEGSLWAGEWAAAQTWDVLMDEYLSALSG